MSEREDFSGIEVRDHVYIVDLGSYDYDGVSGRTVQRQQRPDGWYRRASYDRGWRLLVPSWWRKER